MKRVLMIAYHFPPLTGSSGIQRTLRFVKHLPARGWEPVVLTAHPRAYESVSDDLSSEVPPGVRVERAFALDTARHLAIAGRYPGFLACPDRWVSWRMGAVRRGMRLIRQHRPDVLWSTYPIATAHLIGHDLARRSGIPWVADFRDPMAQDGYPANPRIWRSFKRIEEDAVRDARLSVFTTPGAARVYRQRYPAYAQRITVVENGFDEESFAGWADQPSARQPLHEGAVTLLHSGIVYPSERDPTHLFGALRRLADDGVITKGKFVVRFRASGHDGLLRQLTAQHALGDYVEVLPATGYRDALGEMVRADGLLLLQAANCNEQIPAKLYEYLRARRPILGLTDPAGDTAAALREAGLDLVARLDSTDEIASLLARFADTASPDLSRAANPEHIAQKSREGQAQTLASLFDEVTRWP